MYNKSIQNGLYKSTMVSGKVDNLSSIQHITTSHYYFSIYTMESFSDLDFASVINSTIEIERSCFLEDYRMAIEYRFNRLMHEYFDGNLFKADMVMSLLITVGLYWTVGFIYTLIDLTGRPRFLLRYKIQSTSQVPKQSLWKLARQVLLNQSIGMSLGPSYLWVKYRYFVPSESVPTVSRFVYEIIMFMLIREVLFYYSHRWMHHPSIYRFVHKQHHEWQTPIAIAALYCHPLEHVVVNSIPVLAGPLVMQPHPLTFYLWEIYFILLTLNDHCGYHFPLLSSPIFHDYHHWKFTGNYGILGIFDWLHGTDNSFRKTKYHQMDRVYFSLNPPKHIAEEKFFED